MLTLVSRGVRGAQVRATLQALKQGYDGNKLIVVFQPHTHSRLASFFDGFATAFQGADRVLVTAVYAARAVADTAAAGLEGAAQPPAEEGRCEARRLAESIGAPMGVYTPSLQVRGAAQMASDGPRREVCLFGFGEPSPSKAEPRQKQDWILKCLQDG